MNLQRQILATLAAIVVLLLLLFGTSTYLTKQVAEVTVRRELNAQATGQARDFRYHVAQIQQFLTDVSATHDDGGYDEAREHLNKANAILDKLAQLLPTEQSRVSEIRARLKSFHETGTQMAQTYQRNGLEAGNAVMKASGSGFDARGQALVEAFGPLLEQLVTENQRLSHELEAVEDSSTHVLLGAELLILVVATVALLRLRSQVFGMLGGEPLEAVRISREIASGNLRQQLTHARKDSLIDTMGGMQAQLREFARRTHEAIQGLDKTATELSDSSENLSQSSHEASSATSSMAATVEQLAGSLNAISDNAQQARQASEESGGIARDGAAVIRRTASEMQQIDQVTQTTAQQLASLGSASAKIIGIVQVIKEVADQTNLLALNAAIEAARAGESGRGFAVVADEVRQLAERTAASTKQIQSLVDGVNQAAGTAIRSMSEVEQRVSAGVQLATEAGSAVERITDYSQQVVDVIAEISHALKEQEQAHGDLVQQMNLLTDLSERNSGLAHETSEHAQDMHRLSGNLDQMVGWFKY